MHRRAAIALATLMGLALVVAASAAVIRSKARSDLLSSGEDAYALNAYPKAHRAALEVLKQQPNDRQALLLAARSLSRMSRIDRAEPLFERAGPPFGTEDLHARADGFLNIGRRDEAAEIYRQLLDQAPEDVLALRRLAALEIARDNVPEATRLADRLIGIADGAVIGHTLKGVIAYNGGVFEESAEEFEQVLTLDPNLVEMPLNPRQMFWGYLANSLLNLGRSSDASRHLRRALNDHPEDASFMDLLARCYEHEGKLDQAVQCWQLASSWDPGLPSPWLNLGNAALRDGDPNEAVRLLGKAAELAPEAPEPCYGLSLAYRRLGQREKAEHYQRLANQRKSGTAPQSP